MKAVSVAASRRYDILIERGLLNRAGKLVRSVTNAGTVMLVSDDSVWPLYGETVQKSLEDTGVSVCRFVFPHGEGSKCAKTYLALLDALCETGKAVVGFVTGLVKSVSCSAAKFVKDSTCKAAGCTWDKTKQVAKEYRQVLLIVAAGVSAALAVTAAVFYFMGRKK